MRKRVLFFFFLMVLTLFSCRPQSPKNHFRVVTAITATCEGYATVTRRYYTTEEKMQLILNHIRSIGIRDTPKIDPETLKAKTICITLHYSDGTEKLYRQKANRYFQEGTGPWKEVSPENAEGLYQLILATPSDPEDHRLLRPPFRGFAKPPAGKKVFAEKTTFFKNSS